MTNPTQIFGIRAIIEAINAEKSIDKVFLQKGLRGELFNELEQLIKSKGISCSYVPIEKLNRFDSKNHQGAVATISPVTFVSIETLVEDSLSSDTKPLFLLLDEISDVRNFGAIARTAECTGVTGIVIPKQGAAPINGDAIKTSAGALFKIPICKVDHIKDAIYYLQASDIQVIAATEKTDNSLYDIDFDQPCAIVMGSEGRGVNPSILKIVNQKAKLPMLGTIDSLNVSVACGAFLYEAIRQRC